MTSPAAASQPDPAIHLAPGRLIDSDAPVIRDYVSAHAGEGDDVTRAIRLYYAVRDDLRYDPYDIDYSVAGFSASHTLARGKGFCITKAAVLAAVARAAGIPARLGYADVRNHLATPRLIEQMGTDLFIFHGYTDLWLEGRWVKATPAFNIQLCEKFGVLPLEFDGRTDSIFHPHDAEGRLHMEYVRDRGTYDDVPYEEILATFRETYPRFDYASAGTGGDFEAEAEAERNRT
jgi:transglutaminase-like putative cysteine protease